MTIKSALLVTTCFAFVALVVTGCKKSNSGGGTSGSFSATISGTAWASSVPSAGIYSTVSSEFEFIGGQYKNGDTTGLSVAFFRPFPLNKAISSDTAGVDVGYVDAKTLAEYDGGSTSGHSILTITSWDSVNHKIGGTFSGVLYNIGGPDSLTVTNGSFSSAYTVQ